MAEVLIFNDVNGLLGFGRYSGPYRIASELRAHGYDVQVIEFFASLSTSEFKAIIDTHVDQKTLVVGIGSTLLTKNYSDEELLSLIKMNNSWMQILNSSYVELFPQDDEFINVFFDYIKTKNHKTKIVVGGHKAQKANKKYKLVDYWILGQGESSIVALCNHLKFGKALKTLDTEAGRLLTDKMYPYNNFSCSKITWHKNDHLFKNESVPIETARGCIFKCSFCSFNLNGKKFGDYNKNSDTLYNEFIYNYENFGITDYMIADDTLNDSVEKIDHLHKTITSLPFKITFSAYCRLDIISSHFDMASKLQEMGLTSVNFGIETFNRDAGKAVGKGADPEKLKKTLADLKSLWKDDIYMSAGFIVGLPHETRESINNTFEYLYNDNNPLSAVGVYRLYIRTPTNIKLGNNIELDKVLDAGFVQHKEKVVYDNLSKIVTDPEKYNYGIIDEKWSNEHMSMNDALDLVSTFYSSPLAQQKFSMTYFQDYNRIKNLGFKHSEIKNMRNNNIIQVIDCMEKRKKLRVEYLGKVLG
jgi:hypothetical protein